MGENMKKLILKKDRVHPKHMLVSLKHALCIFLLVHSVIYIQTNTHYHWDAEQ